jgi:hypothetical protein
MAQGFGWGNNGAPEIGQELPSHALVMEITGSSGLVDDAVVTVMTQTGGFIQAELLANGTYYVENGIGSKTTIQIDSPSQGIHSVDVHVDPTPSLASMQVFIFPNGPAKAIAVERRAVAGRPMNPAPNTVSTTPNAATAGGLSNCCTPNGGLGCDDPACEAAVCAVDPFCCDVAWDGICAGEAVDLCGDLCTIPPGKCGVCDSGGICDLQVGINGGFIQSCPVAEGQWVSLGFPIDTGGAMIDTVTSVHNTNTGVGSILITGGNCDGPDVTNILAELCCAILPQRLLVRRGLQQRYDRRDRRGVRQPERSVRPGRVAGPGPLRLRCLLLRGSLLHR